MLLHVAFSAGLLELIGKKIMTDMEQDVYTDAEKKIILRKYCNMTSQINNNSETEYASRLCGKSSANVLQDASKFRSSKVNMTLDDYHNEHLRVYGDRTFAEPIYKYMYPIVIGICLLTTIVLLIILFKRVLIGSPMSRAAFHLLAAIATADVLTLLLALTDFQYQYNIMDENMFLPFDSCETVLILERLSAVSHAASTWLTVIVAIQRYVCISKPLIARKYIHANCSLICVVVVTVLSVAFHICRFLDRRFVKIYFPLPSVPNDKILTCQIEYAYWVKNPQFYESIFAWTRIIVMQLIPCILIVTFVSLMTVVLRKTKSVNNKVHLNKPYKERRQASMFIASSSSLVFTVELSSAIFLSFNAWEISTGNVIFPYEILKAAAVGFDMILYISYFIIFLLYCFMSRDVRNTVFSLCHQIWFYRKKREQGLGQHPNEMVIINTSQSTTIQIPENNSSL